MAGAMGSPLKISWLLLATYVMFQATQQHPNHSLAVEASQPASTSSGAFHKNASNFLAGERESAVSQAAGAGAGQAAVAQPSSSGLLFAPEVGASCSQAGHQKQAHQQVLQQQQQQQATSLSSAILRTFIRTNNMRAYHLDLHSYRPEVKYAGDPAHVNSSSGAHQERCRRHLNRYEQLLSHYKQMDPMEMSANTLEAARLADTFGRPHAGILQGSQFWLGSHENCLDLRISLGAEFSDYEARDDKLHEKQHQLAGERRDSIQSHYCLALAQFPNWKPADTKSSFKIGLCLPESCTSSMLNERPDLFELTERMMKHQLPAGKHPLNRLKLRSVYCLPHPSSELRQLSLSGRLLVGLLASLLLACLYATLHDYLNRKTVALAASAQVASSARVLAEAQQQQQQQQQQEVQSGEEGKVASGSRGWRIVLVESFSLMRNFEKIVDLRERKAEVSQQVANSMDESEREFHFNKDVFFSSITGIKCIGLLWIMAAHCFLVGPITHNNLIALDKLTQTYLANVYLAAHLMVDSFFALSGLLAAYLLFKSGSLDKMTARHWLVLTIHRYWRLTPVYLLCFWFAKTLGHQLSSGPLWDYSTAAQSPRLNCANESWLVALLHLSDFKSPKEHCVPFAWFIANGIKFWIVTPLFISAICRSLRAGYALLAGTIVVNIGVVVSLAINSNVDMKSVIQFKPESADNMLNNMEEVYTRPYSRIGAYLVGLMAGHMIYLLEAQRQPLRMSEKMKILIWSLVCATTILLTFVIKIAAGVELEEAAIPWVFSFSSAIIRPLWALCTCWLVFALAHGQARWLSAILSASVWRILARLSFCAYLVQGETIANLYLSASQSGSFQYSHMVSLPIVAAVAIIAISLLVALLVEYPLVGIEELILPKRSDKSSSSSSGSHQSQQQSAGHQLKRELATNGNATAPAMTTDEKLLATAKQTPILSSSPSRGDKLKEL